LDKNKFCPAISKKKSPGFCDIKLWAKGFGEKLLIWLRYAYSNYPNADLYGKADDDVYVCPSMYDTLVENNEPRIGCPSQNAMSLGLLLSSTFDVLRPTDFTST